MAEDITKKYVYVVRDDDCDECGIGEIIGVYDNQEVAEQVAAATVHHGNCYTVELNYIPPFIKAEMKGNK